MNSFGLLSEQVDSIASGTQVGVSAVGATMLAWIIVRPWLYRIALGGLFAVAGASLYLSRSDSLVPDGYEIPALLAFTALSFLLSALFLLMTQIRFRFFGRRVSVAERLRGILLPSAWKEDDRPSTGREQMRRWFVAVAVATGCWASRLMVEPTFWSGLADSVRPIRVVSMIALTAVAVVLIGPIEEYVLGRGVIKRTPAGTPKLGNYETLFEELAENFSWRALGRLFLILGIGFQINIIHSCLERATENPTVITEAFLSAIVPALVSYYWTASLERNVASVARTAGWASVAAFGILVAPIGQLLLFAGPLFATKAYGILAALTTSVVLTASLGIVGILFCWLTGASLALPAFLGAFALDRARRRGLSPIWSAFLLAAALAPAWLSIAAASGLLSVVTSDASTTAMFNILLVQFGIGGLSLIVGWIAGLALGGFPPFVSQSRIRAPGSMDDHSQSIGRLRRAVSSPGFALVLGLFGWAWFLGRMAYLAQRASP